MEFRISQKPAFTVAGLAKRFQYKSSEAEIPSFWKELYVSGKSEFICGQYGVCIDDQAGTDDFEYLIADNYDPSKELAAGLTTRTIPAFTWAIFACKGAIPMALQNLNKAIFSKWLPENGEYEMAGGYGVELYANPADYRFGTADPQYECEIWIPVKRK